MANKKSKVTPLPIAPKPRDDSRKLGVPLKVKHLLATHKLYKENKKEWDFLMAMFEGIREIVRIGLVYKHEREPQVAFERRLQELYSLGYSKSVVEIFQHFLFKKSPQDRVLDKLHDDELWKLFYEDADLYGDSYEATLMEITLYAGVLGHMGILVDKANTQDEDGKETVINRKDEIKNRVYPYLAKYFPQAILDWDFSRDDFNRPFLNYLKLKEDDDQYRLWSPERWEVWELPKNDKGQPDDSNQEANAKKINEGTNPLGEVPFVWHYNFKSRHQCIGKGDIQEIGRIDLSIIRNLSQIEQIINFAAFPQMRKPLRSATPTESSAPQQDDEVSVEAVLEFDADNPDSKPDWLKAEVKEPIDATWSVIIGKISEIYRAANIGGLAATEPTKDAQSGVAKQTDFQMLNAKLKSKAINLENTENRVVDIWLKWQKQWDDLRDKVKMSRPKTYDIENLATDLANALTAKTVVVSKTFNSLIQKQSARQALPGATEQELADMDAEIDENVEKMNEAKTTPEVDATNEDESFIQDGARPSDDDANLEPNNKGDNQGSKPTEGE